MGIAACADERGDDLVAARQDLSEDVYQPPAGVSLLVTDARAELRALGAAMERLGGTVFHALPPRMLIARLPAGADAVLGHYGVTARFDGPVPKDALADASVAERRFAEVFGNRYYAPRLALSARIVHDDAPPPAGEAFERPPISGEQAKALGLVPAAVDLEAERNVFVPYAAGTMVVAVWLPESNGVAEPSTETWDDAMILQVYDKIQAALEAVARHEPLARLKFVLHYESAPANGGLDGTIDTDWEFGKHANFGSWSDELMVVADVTSQVLGREITESDVWLAQRDYLNDLRDRYAADGAFIILVGANGNDTAYLRAHASINGPSTTLPSNAGWEVFMHEFGHIFGAIDEYCPDACASPTALHGYLGIVNANASYREGEPGGIHDGRGEDQPSLMIGNTVNAVNGYTRGSWGWADADGDGVLDVLDTEPDSALSVWAEAGVLRVRGSVEDQPASPLFATPFSVNRIERLEYRFADVAGAPWLAATLAADTRGRQDVDVELGAVPAGRHAIELRAVNSVGNREPAKRFVVDSAKRGNAAPHANLAIEPAVASTASELRVRVAALDLDGRIARVRLDLDADGRFETELAGPGEARARFARPGVYELAAQVIDGRGAATVATAEVAILDRNAPPVVELGALVSPQHGAITTTAELAVASLYDPDGDALELNWITEVADGNFSQRRETGFAPGATRFTTELSTPLGLRTQSIRLDGDRERPGWVRKVALIAPDILAVAMGPDGVLVLDIADRRRPVALAELALESVAESLYVHGDRLYASGGTLSVIDTSDPRRPRELVQRTTTTASRVVVNDSGAEISEDYPLWYDLQTPWREKIGRLAVTVAIDHPNHRELAIELVPPKALGAEPILLARGVSGKGRRVYRFNDRTTPALARFVGRFAVEQWVIRVTDEVVNKQVGRLGYARLDVRTAHRAVPLMSEAAEVIGGLYDRFLVVAGEGLQILDAGADTAVREASRVSGTGYYGGGLVGTTAVVLSPLEPKSAGERGLETAPGVTELGGFGWPLAPRSRGLYAVDLAFPYRPRVVRVVDELEPRRLTIRGEWMFLEAGMDGKPPTPRVEFDRPTTYVGDARVFARGGDWRLGSLAESISPASFLDGDTLWNVSDRGMLQRIDISDPAAPEVLTTFERPLVYDMLRLNEGEILFQNGWSSSIARTDEITSTISRVFQITVEARDASGAISRDTRTIHLVPYDHAPRIEAVEVAQGDDTRDRWVLRVHVADPDAAASWDPHRMVRADLDGDGRFDSGWRWTYGEQGTVDIETRFPVAGRYELAFEARDGFMAGSPRFVTAIEVRDYAPVACASDRDCGAGEFCLFGLEAGCGGAGALGVCEDPSLLDCKDQPPAEVCGCDGRNYYSACDAHRSGVSVASEGACPVIACGGDLGDTCGEAQYCNYAIDAACGADGAEGVCAERPQICLFPRPGNEVCGCDGQTYASWCHAASAGVSVERVGRCQPDCRDVGCEDGAICVYCFVGFVCMPEGASC